LIRFFAEKLIYAELLRLASHSLGESEGVYACVCVCVCVRERESERESERDRERVERREIGESTE